MQQPHGLANVDARCFFNTLVQILRACHVEEDCIPSHPPCAGPEDLLVCLELLLPCINRLPIRGAVPGNVRATTRAELSACTPFGRFFYGRMWDRNNRVWCPVPRGISGEHLSLLAVDAIFWPRILVVQSNDSTRVSNLLKPLSYHLYAIAEYTNGHYAAMVMVQEQFYRCDDALVTQMAQFPTLAAPGVTWTLFYYQVEKSS